MATAVTVELVETACPVALSVGLLVLIHQNSDLEQKIHGYGEDVLLIPLQNTYRSPVYTTSQRRNAMGVGLVFEADLATHEHISHWVLQGVCLTLNSDWKMTVWQLFVFVTVSTLILSLMLRYDLKAVALWQLHFSVYIVNISSLL